MEYQAVVMAAGKGSRMTDLTSRTPKPLLPVGNKPMIWYSINMLDKAGFTEAIVIVLKSAQTEVSKVLKEFIRIQFDIVTLPDDHDKGTVDSLKLVRNKIKSDVLVLSCDIVTYISLHQLADVHRTSDATVTMLLTHAPNISETIVPCPKANRRIERDLIGLDERHRHVLYCASESDLEEYISFKMADLHRYPYMEIHTKLLDAHLYIVKKEVLDLPEITTHDMKTMKGDLIPFLVKRQYCSEPLNSETESTNGMEGHVNDDSHKDSSLITNSCFDSVDDLIRNMSTWSNKECERTDGHGAVRCCAYVLDEASLCLRANTLVTYCEANKQIASHISQLEDGLMKKTALPNHAYVDASSMSGEGVTMMEKVGVKSSIIGSHCEIGQLSKIVNCIIMDHVRIGNGVKLTGCVVCEKVSVGDKAELTDSVVCGSQSVPGDKKYRNEVIMLERAQMMEI